MPMPDDEDQPQQGIQQYFQIQHLRRRRVRQESKPMATQDKFLQAFSANTPAPKRPIDPSTEARIAAEREAARLEQRTRVIEQIRRKQSPHLYDRRGDRLDPRQQRQQPQESAWSRIEWRTGYHSQQHTPKPSRYQF